MDERERELLADLASLGRADRDALPQGGVSDAVMRAVAREPDLALVARAPVAEATASKSWLTRPMVPLWAVALLLVALGGVVVWSATRPASHQLVAQPNVQPNVQRNGAAARAAVATATKCAPALAAKPCAAAPVYVYRFVLRAPGARRVAVVGDFNGWKQRQTLMRDDNGDGTWSVTLRLEPGRYRYKFLVDGQRWVLDPDAPASTSDGFGGRNAVITL